MPEITDKELKERYPNIYQILKAAQDFKNSYKILIEEIAFIDAESSKDPSFEKEERLKVRLGILDGTIKYSIDLVNDGIKTLQEVSAIINKDRSTNEQH
jgi:hypothetical protein